MALTKGVVLRINVAKGWKDKPHRLDLSVHRQKKEILVDGKSGVASYKLTEASGSHSGALAAKTGAL